ncbi:hypothetical protein POJ06DRAFT_235859 [Lipomyces tetrasporus]|uniref:Uncharacterized protein n=1 Tax=Lipomyces tetrasporus TaxID=54092 RepID=A0AAD7QX02_9ASCO|nr:uncharacterized protein POJ06DRAFT_235859 [Lipomyces tetrasporus]KAJ8102915.1 hypothetical protein POJ06DRAFT_235859 [Lipomyces tetrasporus]
MLESTLCDHDESESDCSAKSLECLAYNQTCGVCTELAAKDPAYASNLSNSDFARLFPPAPNSPLFLSFIDNDLLSIDISSDPADRNRLFLVSFKPYSCYGMIYRFGLSDREVCAIASTSFRRKITKRPGTELFFANYSRVELKPSAFKTRAYSLFSRSSSPLPTLTGDNGSISSRTSGYKDDVSVPDKYSFEYWGVQYLWRRRRLRRSMSAASALTDSSGASTEQSADEFDLLATCHHVAHRHITIATLARSGRSLSWELRFIQASLPNEDRNPRARAEVILTTASCIVRREHLVLAPPQSQEYHYTHKGLHSIPHHRSPLGIRAGGLRISVELLTWRTLKREMSGVWNDVSGVLKTKK